MMANQYGGGGVLMGVGVPNNSSAQQQYEEMIRVQERIIRSQYASAQQNSTAQKVEGENLVLLLLP